MRIGNVMHLEIDVEMHNNSRYEDDGRNIPVLNQCDGCVAGVTRDDEGFHTIEGRTYMLCQEDRYEREIS